MNRVLLLAIALLSTSLGYTQKKITAKNVEHNKVFHEKGMYGGWPANNGIWIWGDEILVGFSKGTHKDLGSKHNIDRDKPQYVLLARSKNGGKTWTVEDPAQKGMVPHGHLVAKPRTDVPQQKVIKLQTPINFKHPDFAMTAFSNGDPGESRYWFSYNRGQNWQGPYALPNFGAPGTEARTDYIVDDEYTCTVFTTAAKANGKEGRLMAIRTTDGGKSWNLLSLIGDDPAGYTIMPASVRISATELLVVARKKEGDRSFIPAWYSNNNGNNWTEMANASDDTGIGSPPALIKLQDGRLCLVYGYRSDAESIAAGKKTSDIRARLSGNNGKSWSKEYVLRNDGSNQDIGYPRIVQRKDGKVVVIYYFVDDKTGPERYIGASIWSPPAAGKE